MSLTLSGLQYQVVGTINAPHRDVLLVNIPCYSAFEVQHKLRMEGDIPTMLTEGGYKPSQRRPLLWFNAEDGSLYGTPCMGQPHYDFSAIAPDFPCFRRSFNEAMKDATAPLKRAA